MQEIYITITKTAAPAGTGNGCKNTSTHENVGTPIVRRKKRRVNRYHAAVIGVREALISAAVWLPVAYMERGYWAVGGEWLLIIATGVYCWWRARERE